MSAPALRIPYGVADFVKLRRGGEYYVNKTAYLPLLEQAGRFLFLIRPRRFGKSLLQSVTECYYDRRWEPHFDELFHDTWIYAHPTPEKYRYLGLRFDFSAVDSDSRKLAPSFENYCRIRPDGFLGHYADRIPQAAGERIQAQPTVADCLSRLQEELELLCGASRNGAAALSICTWRRSICAIAICATPI